MSIGFKEYQHLERLGTDEVEGIEFGTCYVFPKIDGSNASIWMDDGELCAGSRRRQLSETSDNAGFYKWVQENKDRFLPFFRRTPEATLYGEWLVPHSLKTYRDDAWRRFYVFDAYVNDASVEYDVLAASMEEFGLDYIPPIAIIKNGSYEQFVEQLAKNVFLIDDGKGAGEGVVIKNYQFKNRFGRTTWAKIVTNEFKEKHVKAMGASEIQGEKLVEEDIAVLYVTKALCEKEHAKIKNDTGWSSQNIPQLLNTIYYSVITEEAWNFVKKFKDPKVDFKRLKHFVFASVKQQLPEVFA